ncbi:hypothetical protein EON00_05940 [Burkholderia sp. ISTR5]|nr:hypothetical protein [Burkholderia sp. ISTR5]
MIDLSEASGKTLHAAAGQPFFSLVASLATVFPQHAPVPGTGLRRCLPARLSWAMSDYERYGRRRIFTKIDRISYLKGIKTGAQKYWTLVCAERYKSAP